MIGTKNVQDYEDRRRLSRGLFTSLIGFLEKLDSRGNPSGYKLYVHSLLWRIMDMKHIFGSFIIVQNLLSCGQNKFFGPSSELIN